jgi:quinoprotein glucose dehydrogenase
VREISVFCLALGCSFLVPPRVQAQKANPYTTWSDYGGGADASQYSSLSQINRSNVNKLEIAWTYPTADGGKYLFNPIVVDGVMYVLAKNNAIVALDAATGKELWVHENPHGRVTTRGINYWESADRSERRLLFSNNNFLEAINARTGQSISSFGVNGSVDLKEGLGRDPASISAQSLTPGRVFENLIILGSATNQEYDSAPGLIFTGVARSAALRDAPAHRQRSRSDIRRCPQMTIKVDEQKGGLNSATSFESVF